MVRDNKNLEVRMKAAMKMFRRASELLKVEGEKALSKRKKCNAEPIGTELVISSIVLYAFTCEIALKALEKKEKINIINTHDLKKLFESLSGDAKMNIEREVMQRYNRGQAGGDFRSLLENNKDAFNEWRYYYEPKKKRIDADLEFLKEFYTAVEAECER